MYISYVDITIKANMVIMIPVLSLTADRDSIYLDKKEINPVSRSQDVASLQSLSCRLFS